MKKILLSASLCLLIFSSNAQKYSFEHYNKGNDTIKVIEGNKTLLHPFSGGLDVPQFAECDLDLDGKLDLVVFDREGGRLTTFLNKGAINTTNYIYAPEYIAKFPKVVDWLQMVDYDGDGRMDIFTAIPGGLRVYRNISNDINGLQFQNKFPEILCDYTSLTTRLYIGNIDMPAILDVDDDGDVDILTFYQSIDTSGESIYWYKNMSKERLGIADSMDFIIGKYCWGGFRESFSDCNIRLQYPLGPCGNGERFIPNISPQEFMDNMNKRILAINSGGAHSGSTTVVFDANNDGKKDMLIGDVTCTNMYLVVNSTNNQTPIMNQTIEQFPPNHPIVIEVFPAAYSMDINNDGRKDLIATTNTSNASQNTNHVQLYLNNGTNGLNRYDFSTDNFMVSEMIDVSEGASPCFVDYNNDGLMDIVISNTGYWTSSSTTKTGLALYKNTGTNSLAKYELVSKDWLGFSALNIANMCPSFGDMDADGDLDMVCGASDGTLHFFRNIANTGSIMNLQYVPNFFSSIDVGNFSTPFIYDFNNDGKNEIVVAERFDNINLLENTGTIANPNYVIATDSLYKINLKMFGLYPSGRGHLQVNRLRANEAPRVIVSNGNGKIYVFGEVNANYTQKMNAVSDSINLYAGQFSFANGGFNFSMADLNGDAKPELVVGTPQGGLFLYRNMSLGVGINTNDAEQSISVYPNPANKFINIKSNNNDKINKVKFFDINGKLLKEINNPESITRLTIDEFSVGIYFITIQTDRYSLTKKILINNN